MRLDQEDTNAFNTHMRSVRYSASKKVLATNVTLTHRGSLVNFFDAGGVDRTVSLPPTESGRWYAIGNTGTTGNLIVKDFNNVTVTTVLPGMTVVLFSDELVWSASGGSAYSVFTNTLDGLVPAPHSGAPGSLFLRDDGQWAGTAVTVSTDCYRNITDGVNTAVGVGPDTFRLRSSTSKVGITVTNNQVTFGDNADMTVNEAFVDHNALLNYVANRHIDHSAVTLTAGLGISGGGDITVARTFDFAPTELTVQTPGLSDYVVWDLAAGGPRKTLWSTLNGVIDHDLLFHWVANKHIDHSAVSIVASTGLSGGGDITTSRSLALDINGLTVDVPASGDFMPFFDISGGDTNRVTLANLGAALNTITGALTSLVVGTTTVTGGTTGRILFDNAGILGEYTLTGSAGAAVMSVSPALTGTPTAPTAAFGVNSTQLATMAAVFAVTGGSRITVSNTAPSTPAVNDVWIDTT